VDFTKIARLLPEYNPKWNARLGAQQLHKAYQTFGLTMQDFEGRKYIRLNQLKHLLDAEQLDEQLRWKVWQPGSVK
jgi:hypothetical protein